MSLAERVALAAVVVVVDALAFAVPLTGLVIAYVVIARPGWFVELVAKVYGDSGSGER